jgi:hypothetical protein
VIVECKSNCTILGASGQDSTVRLVFNDHRWDKGTRGSQDSTARLVFNDHRWHKGTRGSQESTVRLVFNRLLGASSSFMPTVIVEYKSNCTILGASSSFIPMVIVEYKSSCTILGA